jgi:hypothetical protein
MGRSFHKGYEYNFKQKLQTGVDMKINDVKEVAISFYEEDAKKEEIENKEKIGEGKDLTAKSVETYYPVATTINPEFVEKEIKIQNFQIPIVGYIDLSIPASIIDYKLTTKRPNEELKYSIQRYLYSVGYFLITKKHPNFIFHYIRPLKRQILYEPYNTKKLTNVEIRWYEKLLQHIILDMKETLVKDNFYPTGDPMTVCSWCGYYDLCRNKKW